MLDIKILRENQELVKESLRKRNRDSQLVDDFLIVDREWRELILNLDEARAKQNKLTKERKIDEAKALKEEVKKLEVRLPELEKKREEMVHNFPNIPADEVPMGKDESENVVLKEVGERPKFDFEPKDYLVIGEKLDVIDVGRGAKVAGSRFGYLKGKAALLEVALIQFALNRLTKKGFQPVIPPVMIKPEVYRAIGRLASGQKEERYFIEKDNLYLVGTAEHTILAMHVDEILKDKELPRRYAGFSTCFRREAGSYGKDTNGILRVHQFDKVEMVSFTRPEDSEQEHKFLLACQEELMQELKLPYRVVQICTGDLGWTDYKQYDIETWLPGQGVYRETQSCSNTTDFQTRGMNCKSDRGGFAHALNATAIAIQRMVIAIIENYQTKDGDFDTPEALKNFFLKI
jgi:seryl-tRNA synthetase